MRRESGRFSYQMSREPDRSDVPALHARIADLEARHRARDRDEVHERHHAKLASLGQLTAGVAHELNTPLQFITDNLHFLRDGVHGVLTFVEALQAVRHAAATGSVHPDLLHAVDAAELACDFEYVLPRVDRSFKRTFDGLERITTIVDAMKRFSHPRNELGEVELDRVIETTLVMAANEYKYIADVVTELGGVPPIAGHMSDLGQVFLNLLVNAAHAIVDRNQPGRGTITVTTRHDGDHVEVAIADTGCGIPVELREQVFEPFFTTKAPGRGTGQGLALAHAVIVGGHHGEILLESEVGRGTTIRVRLPRTQPARIP